MLEGFSECIEAEIVFWTLGPPRTIWHGGKAEGKCKVRMVKRV